MARAPPTPRSNTRKGTRARTHGCRLRQDQVTSRAIQCLDPSGSGSGEVPGLEARGVVVRADHPEPGSAAPPSGAVGACTSALETLPIVSPVDAAEAAAAAGGLAG